MTTPTAQPPGDHRLGSTTVVLIIVVAMIVAIAATAAVVFTGPETTNTPPTDIDVTPAAMASASAAATVGPPAATGSATLPRGVSAFTFGPGTLPQRPAFSDLPSEAYEFDAGVSLDIPEGWSIVDKDSASVMLGTDDDSEAPALVVVAVATLKVRDIKRILQADVNARKKRLDNFEVDLSTAKSFDMKGKNFQQAMIVTYSGDLSTQKGTYPLVGMIIELLDPKTGLSALLDYFSPDQEILKARAGDIDAIIESMA